MCTTTLTLAAAAVAITRLTHHVCYEVCTLWQPEEKAEPKPLRMNWVVVTDEHGKKQLRVYWTVIQPTKS
jgi:hypothetical protein